MWHNQTNIECLAFLVSYLHTLLAIDQYNVQNQIPFNSKCGLLHYEIVWYFILEIKQCSYFINPNIEYVKISLYWLLSSYYISLPYHSCSYIKPIMDVIGKLKVQSTFILHGRYHQNYHGCRPVVLIYYVCTVFVQSSTNCILSFKIIYHYWFIRLLRKPLSEIAK